MLWISNAIHYIALINVGVHYYRDRIICNNHHRQKLNNKVTYWNFRVYRMPSKAMQL